MRYYIEAFTKPGDFIFDPFLGGGTSAAVCKGIGRRLIGIDNDKKAFKVSVERVRNQIPQAGDQIVMEM